MRYEMLGSFGSMAHAAPHVAFHTQGGRICMPCSVQCVAAAETLDALAPEWQGLCDRDVERFPFNTVEWQRAWWSHFRADRVWLRDVAWVRTFRSSEGALVGIAPLMLTRRPSLGWPSFRELQFFGADPNATEVRGLVCA